MTKFTNVIMLKYPTDGQINAGLINLNYKYILDENRLDCLGAEFSDSNIASKIEDTDMLTNIDSQMKMGLTQ
jgi:hypothetical protein